MNVTQKIDIDFEAPSPPFMTLLVWFLGFNVLVFVGYVVVAQGYWAKMLVADQSKISLLIVIVFVAASFHVAVCLFRACCYQERIYERLGKRAINVPFADKDIVSGYLDEMQTLSQSKKPTTIDQANYIFEIYVDRLRAPIELGSFWSDVLIRLGLIGTIVGFIFMLQSFVSGPDPSSENIQNLLITMSSGMGTALYTTFAGLIASTLLSLQHQLLGRTTERVIAGLIRLTDQPSVSPLTDRHVERKEV